MKNKLLLLTLSLLLVISACTTTTEETNETNADKPAETNQETAEKPKEEEKEFTGEMKFAFDDFPAVETSAKQGEYVLVPSYNWLEDLLQKDPTKVTVIWYTQKMENPGPEASDVKFMSDTKKVPNGYIVPIPAGQKAQKGDVVLTWWQSGSGMKRGYVTDASNPAEPKVRYLDIDYDNPAKSRDKSTTIGQMDEQLKPDSFVVIKNELEPGTTVAIKDGDKMTHGQVIRVAGDKVFVKKFAGRVGVHPKSDVTAVPVKPNIKAGDKVQVPFVGRFSPATVTKVDDNIGRVFVKYESGSTDEKAIAYGDVIPE